MNLNDITNREEFDEFIGINGEGIIIEQLTNNNYNAELIRNIRSCIQSGKLNACWSSLCAHNYIENNGLLEAIREACDCFTEALLKAKIGKENSIHSTIWNMKAETAWGGVSLKRNKRKRIRIYDRRKEWPLYPGSLPSAELFSLGNFLMYMTCQKFIANENIGHVSDIIAIKVPLMYFIEYVVPWFKQHTRGQK